jgi:Co/Zn/Cd efflux system component
MSKHCCPVDTTNDSAYRKILIIALIINAGMFLLEIILGIAAGSVSLQADSLDFFGDGFNYAISLYLVGKSLSSRAKGSLIKAGSMLLFGLWILGQAIYRFTTNAPPEAEIITTIGALALVANLICFYLLFKHRSGDSNRRSAWLCTRNDVIGNIAVIFAGIGVYLTASGWPDLIVGTIMAVISVISAVHIIQHAKAELNT